MEWGHSVPLPKDPWDGFAEWLGKSSCSVNPTLFERSGKLLKAGWISFSFLKSLAFLYLQNFKKVTRSSTLPTQENVEPKCLYTKKITLDLYSDNFLLLLCSQADPLTVFRGGGKRDFQWKHIRERQLHVTCCSFSVIHIHWFHP